MKQTHAQLRSAKNAQLGAKTGFEQVSLFCRRYPEEGFRRLSNRTNSSLAAGRGDGAEAHEACPFFPAKTRVLHVGFDDPPTIAAGARTEEEAMMPYRRVRDEIRKFVETLPDALEEEQ